MIEATSENRIPVLDEQTRLSLWQFGERDELAPTVAEVREMLPAELTPAEVDSVGLAVSNYVERRHPSRDAFSHGRKAEDNVIFAIGGAAVLAGDTVTARSAIEHLQRDKFVPSRWLRGWYLGRVLRRHEQAATQTA